MSGRFAPEHGADSLDSLHAAGIPVEPIDRRDDACDYCGRIVGLARQHQVTIGRSTSWMCGPCFDRQQRRFAEQDAMLDAQERGIGGAA